MSSLIWRPEYASYSFGEDHPFSPLRARMTLDLLEALGHHVYPVASSSTPPAARSS